MQPHSYSGDSVAASAAKLILAGAVVTTLTIFAQEAQAQRQYFRHGVFRCSGQASFRYGMFGRDNQRMRQPAQQGGAQQRGPQQGRANASLGMR